jgi:hypothetical protein
MGMATFLEKIGGFGKRSKRYFIVREDLLTCPMMV